MKKSKILKFTALMLGLILLGLSVPVMAENTVSVYLNNEKIQFDVEPKIINGRTMVPMRAIFEKLGAEVTYDGDTHTVHAYNYEKNQGVSMVIGAPHMIDIFMNVIPLDAPSMIENGRTLVPLRAVSEVFKCDVKWDGHENAVFIYSEDFIDFSQTEETIKEIKVSTANELLDAIGSNKKIILTSDYYNLSTVKSVNNEYVEKQLNWDNSYYNAYVFNNVVNMTIEGNAKIVIDDINADVLQFKKCGDITLSGLTIGHTTGNEYYMCEGAVTKFYTCSGINIENCNLFGCGAVGVFAYSSNGIQVKNSRIYDCTYSGIWLDNSSADIYDSEFCDSIHTGGFIRIDNSKITLQNCDVHDIVCSTQNGSGAFIDIFDINSAPSSINIKNCNFANNSFGNITNSKTKNITFKNCSFKNNEGNTEHPSVTYTD